MRIPTTITLPTTTTNSHDTLANNLDLTLLPDIHASLKPLLLPLPPTDSSTPSSSREPLADVFTTFLDNPSLSSVLKSIDVDISQLVEQIPKRWSLYPPLILLPSGSLSSPAWTHLLETAPPPALEKLWADILHTISKTSAGKSGPFTHLAINRGIPPSSSSAHDSENILRSPSHLHLLHGDFGPDIPAARWALPSTDPDAIGPADFEDAFWVRARQNGIVQTWAPRWTMFSRGNVKEKARILGFEAASPRQASTNAPAKNSDPAIQMVADQAAAAQAAAAASSNTQPQAGPGPTATAPHGGEGRAAEAAAVQLAIDLYAGIGYFTLSYLTLGYSVLAWELNPFSVEGLRRGALANGFPITVLRGAALRSPDLPRIAAALSGRPGVVVFEESNAAARARFEGIQAAAGAGAGYRVRHVNLGLLPSSRATWEVAGGLVAEGGCVHAHENVGVEEVAEMGEEVRRGVGEGAGRGRTVRVVHVEFVKSFAPGVGHYVFDVVVGPGLGEGGAVELRGR